MVIIFFSGNLHKAGEIAQILQHCEVRLYSDFVEKFSVEENGKTFAQNAKIKLLALKDRLDGLDMAQFGGRRVVLMAEDSGICVEGLGGEPGVYSARFFSRNASLVGNLSLELHSADLANRHKARTQSPLSLCRFTKNHESQTENPSVVDSAESAESSKKIKCEAPKKSFCYFLLSQKVESHFLYRLQSTKKRNFAESFTESTLDSTIPQNLTRKAQNHRISHEKCESAPDSANSQNLARSAKSFCSVWLLPKVESSLPYRLQTTKKGKFADSAPDSTIPQNLPRKAQNYRISHEVRKSFCSVWLLPKVESPLPYRLQSTKKRNFAESNTDFLNNLCVINKLKSLNIAESPAYFISCVACYELSSPRNPPQNISRNSQNPPQILTAHGFLNGKVITQIRGENGFGYDPIFVPDGFHQTLGEISTEGKNALSHRANAIKLMALLLR